MSSFHTLQKSVHVGKDKRNEFGGYNYRTAEGILSAIKAEMPEGATIVVSDTMQEVAGQIFVTATAKLSLPDEGEYTAQGHAMHPITKKGMDPSQITGAASSYARKYALAGLMALDDGSVDPDATNKGDPMAVRDTSWERTIIQDLPPDSTPRDKAEAIAKGLCLQWGRKKSVGKLSNEWDRRAHLVERLEQTQPDLHETVVDAYHNREEAIKEPA